MDVAQCRDFVREQQPASARLYSERLENACDQLRKILDVRFKSNPFRPLSRRFAIAHTPRVGSHLLCEGLLRHGAVVEEFFEVPRLASVCARHGFSTLEAYCDWLLRKFAVGRVFGVSGGVKILAPLALAGEFPDFLADWRFVHLKRLNIVKQGVSEFIALRTGAYKSSKQPIRALGVGDYDNAKILRAINASLAINATWEEAFKLFAIEPLRLTYEELAASPAEVIARAADFLDLRGPPITDGRFLDPPLQRQATSLNAEWEARFREENGEFCALHAPTPGVPT
ncbi:MAG: hypothetical protein H0X27_00670 [Caulobacteraceae bacterium]|nr:hypothetical protein [Caulobacteraceae bacterium]